MKFKIKKLKTGKWRLTFRDKAGLKHKLFFNHSEDLFFDLRIRIRK